MLVMFAVDNMDLGNVMEPERGGRIRKETARITENIIPVSASA